MESIKAKVLMKSGNLSSRVIDQAKNSALGMTPIASEAAIPAAIRVTIEVVWFIDLKRYLYPEGSEEADKDAAAVLVPR